MNDQDISSSIQEEKLANVIRKCVADFYTADAFADYESNQQEILCELKKYIKNEIEKISSEKYTHYFPAWVLLDENEPFFIGPVKISGRERWVDDINLPKSIEKKQGRIGEIN